MKILYVSAQSQTDLSVLLSESGAEVCVITTEGLVQADLSLYDGFVFDGSNSENGLLFTPAERLVADAAAESGKPVFCMLCPYIATLCCIPPKSTRFARPVVTSALNADGLCSGDILDEQCNKRVSCYTTRGKIVPLMYYKSNPKGFYTTEVAENPSDSDAALWFESDSMLVCSFAPANFARARFAPKLKWFAFFRFILHRLFSLELTQECFLTLYEKNGYYTRREQKPLDTLLENSLSRAIDWYFSADTFVYKNGLPYTVTEGLSAEIYPDGSQQRNRNVTTDTAGETAILFMLDDLLCGSDTKAAYTEALGEYAISHVHDCGGELDGYGSSGDGAWWNACYGDGVVRGIILPRLFSVFLGGSDKGLERALECLDFLVRTTGSDGLRFCRTDIIDKAERTVSVFSLDRTERKWNWGNGGIFKASELPNIEAKTPSAHYNGYYLATLLFAYKVTGRKLYRDTAVRGLTTIMEKYYPDTAREHSETEELCRLILPLSYLYWVTREEKHRQWLYTVIASLEEKKRDCGAFIEWDTGYTACCAGTSDTECSVLAENGNPVVDLLYSLNWLPFSLSQAYFITRDEHIRELFESVSRFLVSIQLHSSNKYLDGAWARAFDIDSNEVYGVPNDVGWAPWSVETGWTMAQIPSGFALWLLRDEIEKLYR